MSNVAPLRHRLPGLTGTRRQHGIAVHCKGDSHTLSSWRLWHGSVTQHHSLHRLLVILRQKHGTLLDVLWFILVYEFTANKHNSPCLNVFEAWAEIWMSVQQGGELAAQLQAIPGRKGA